LATGLLGILLAAMMAGLCSRMPALVLADIQGGLGFSQDDASWLTTAYAAGELAAMPFAAWFAITFSMRRFHLMLLAVSLVLSAVQPQVHDLHLLIVLRAAHGTSAGALVPILMMAALRFLPASIRLHGLALFAMTATLAPNVAVWLSAQAVDGAENWRLAFWLTIPVGALAWGMVAWGIPAMPPVLARLRHANWLGMGLGMTGLALLVVGIDQGVRLDWFNSPLITAALGAGATLTTLFLLSEWLHPAPFVRLDLFGRRNIAFSAICLVCMLTVMLSAVAVPAGVLARLHGFRLAQTAPLGLIVGLPQLVLGSCVSWLLYRRWVDARHVFAVGMSCMAAACWLASDITDQWMVRELLGSTLLHVIGQPLAMVAMLYLVVSVVQPMEGPFLAGVINIVRVLATIIGGAFIGELTAVRTRFHLESLRDQVGLLSHRLTDLDTPGGLIGTVAREAGVLAAADVYRSIAVIALLLIPLILNFQHIPAPVLPDTPASGPSAARA
jgi:DHA2 family multidrug resistance protein